MNTLQLIVLLCTTACAAGAVTLARSRALAKRVRVSLRRSLGRHGDDIRVRASGSSIHLSGWVDSAARSLRADELTIAVSGVATVDNCLMHPWPTDAGDGVRSTPLGALRGVPA